MNGGRASVEHDDCHGNAIRSCRLQAADYVGKWVLLFFYPKDFTFVCPTEIIAFSEAASKFAEKNCAVIGASTDSAEVHLAWINTPRKRGGLGEMKIPLLADVTRRISKAYGVLGEGNFPYRGIFLMDPKARQPLSSSLKFDWSRALHNIPARTAHRNCRFRLTLPCVQPHG
jgi:alkyl hydroperoxide reductase subunit AhpC